MLPQYSAWVISLPLHLMKLPADCRPLVDAILQLAHAAGNLGPINSEETLTISPGALNMLCSYGLFDDDALKHLQEMGTTQQRHTISILETEKSVSNLYPNTSLVLPRELVFIYGHVFVELARLVSRSP
jgi:hypothetical protein